MNDPNQRLIAVTATAVVTLVCSRNLGDGIAERRAWRLVAAISILSGGCVKLLKPSMRMVDLSIARVPPKQADAHYQTVDWKELRARVFARDHHICVVTGCHQPAKVCEHIVSRRAGGSDEMSNLCSLCRGHDNHFKENPDGTRKNMTEWLKIFAGWVGGLKSLASHPLQPV